jgi:hypothetical protein
MDNPTRSDDLGVPVGEAIQVASPTNLFGVQPVDVIRQASALARPLRDVIVHQKLYAPIRDKNYVLVEGWTLLGSMLGVFPIVVWTRRVEADDLAPGWEACVEARTRSGDVVGRAEAMCTRDEKMWASRDDYALRAMAQTRATSRAMRGPLGFVMKLAGYEATAAEEMPRDE